jgi:hypothetical protein
MTKTREALLFVGQEIAFLELSSIDNYWVSGQFVALPAFGQIADLISRLERAYAGEHNDTSPAEDPDQLQSEVDRLDLRVRTRTGLEVRIRDFKIQNGRYEYKVAHEASA